MYRCRTLSKMAVIPFLGALWNLYVVNSLHSIRGNQSNSLSIIPPEIMEFSIIPMLAGIDNRAFAGTCSHYRDLVWKYIACQTMTHYHDFIQVLGIPLHQFMHVFTYTRPSAHIELAGRSRGTFIAGNQVKIHYVTFKLGNRTNPQDSTKYLFMEALNGRLFRMRMMTLRGTVMECTRTTNRTMIFLVLKASYKRALYDSENSKNRTQLQMS